MPFGREDRWRNSRKSIHYLASSQDIWNMDETGFRIGCGRAQIVITLDPRKPLYMTDPDNHDYITSVECISSAGDVILPLLILSGIHILHK